MSDEIKKPFTIRANRNRDGHKIVEDMKNFNKVMWPKEALERLYNDVLSQPRIMDTLRPLIERNVKDMFRWEYQGHDPYNHHGRFMHNIYAPMITTKFVIGIDLASKHDHSCVVVRRGKDMIIIDEFSNWPIGDPRNHHGKYFDRQT